MPPLSRAWYFTDFEDFHSLDLSGLQHILNSNMTLTLVVYLWGFYDIKFKLTQYKSKLGLIPQYTFDLREFDITNLKLGSFQGVQIPKPSLIPQYT